MNNKTLFTGGLVFDGKSELSESIAVLIEDNRIVDVVSRAAFEGLSGDLDDTNDATLVPGLPEQGYIANGPSCKRKPVVRHHHGCRLSQSSYCI
jgi:hypothetical protein